MGGHAKERDPIRGSKKQERTSKDIRDMAARWLTQHDGSDHHLSVSKSQSQTATNTFDDRPDADDNQTVLTSSWTNVLPRTCSTVVAVSGEAGRA